MFFKKKSKPIRIEGHYAFAWYPEVECKDFRKVIDYFRVLDIEIVGMRYLKSDDRFGGNPSIEFVVMGTGDKLFVVETMFDEEIVGYRQY